jgi:uncharacterized protein (TIGR03067 family)
MHPLATAAAMRVLFFATVVPAPPITAEDIPGLLEGEWVVVKAEMAAHVIPQSEWGTAKFISRRNGRHEVEWEGQNVRTHSVYSVGADRKLLTIDFAIHRLGPNGAVLLTCRGILEIDDKSLRICARVCDLNGDAVRPRGFATPTPDDVFVIHLKRAPAEK